MNRLPKFCPQCGGPLELEPLDGRERPICPACGHIVYLNPAPSVAAVMFKDGRVLLVRRSVNPGLGLWCLPGGFIEMDETPEEALVREVNEETGLTCRPVRLLGAESVLGGYYGDIVILGYVAEYVDGSLLAGCDADDADFFSPDQLPPMAFHIHTGLIIRFLRDQKA